MDAFLWQVADGYEIGPLRGKGHAWFQARGLPNPEQLLGGDLQICEAADATRRTYDPLRQHTGLFQMFATMARTPDAVLGFASRFGLLEGPVPGSLPAAPAAPESLAVWFDEQQSMADTVACLDFLQNPAPADTLDRSFRERIGLVHRPHWPVTAPMIVRGDELLPANDGVARDLVRLHARRIIERRVIERVVTRLDLTEGFVTRPRDLLTVLWLQAGAALAKQKVFHTCRACGEPFELSIDVYGKRTDAEMCSNRCKQLDKRRRKKAVTILLAMGRSAAYIHKETGVELDVIQRWARQGSRRRR